MRSLLTGLMLLLPSGYDEPKTQAPKEQLKAIERAQQEASRQYHKALDEAKSEEKARKAVDDFLARVVQNADAALDLARCYPHDPAALDALVFAIRTAKAGPSDRAERAIVMLTQAHVRDEGMGDVCQQLFIFFHLPVAEDLIRTVLEQNPRPAERGLACHALAHYLTYQARMVRKLRENPAIVKDYEQIRGKSRVERLLREKDPNTLERGAERLLERAISEYRTVPYDRRTLGEVAQDELFELHHLRVGKVAPDIKGEDVDGGRFKLSDYRGKVVVLTFSGNWCGPCRAMYPQEREMVKRLEGKPFAMLSVNTDQDKETLRKAIMAGEITWRCWWDGGVEGPITTRWSPESFPTVYVLDSKGVIRDINKEGEVLNEAVDTLLKEMETAKSRSSASGG